MAAAIDSGEQLTALTNTDYLEGRHDIMTIIVVSDSPTDLDSIEIRKDQGAGALIVPPVTVSGTTPFWREVLVNGRCIDPGVAVNTGNRATVYINRAHAGMHVQSHRV